MENKENKIKQIELILENLNCTACASKIEERSRKLEGIKELTLDFIGKKLKFLIDENENTYTIINKIKNIVNELEPDVNVIAGKDKKSSQQLNHYNNKLNLTLLRLVFACVLFASIYIISIPSLFLPYVFLTVYLVAGIDILTKAVKNIYRGQVFDENFLMAVATLGAIAIGEYPEAIAVMLFYQTGKYFQDKAVNHSRKSIADLLDIKPEYANYKNSNGEVRKVHPSFLKKGDIIIVKPGEKIPVDGRIINGNSSIDTSALTGESLPVDVFTNDTVLSGSINNNGLLTIRVEQEFDNSAISKILNLIENAGTKKAPTENLITKLAKYYTPFVVFSAAAIAIIPTALNYGDFSHWLYRSLIFLVISCPCALVISIPLSFFSGIGKGAKEGILIKGSNYLEALNQADWIVFDKTGTLTKGVFEISDINPEEDFTKEKLLEYAAFAESYSNHPIAKCILKAYNKIIDKKRINNYEEIPGYGIEVKINNSTIITAGNEKLMNMKNIQFHNPGIHGTSVHVGVNNKYAGNIIISDILKEDSINTIQMLKNHGLNKIAMLTGDNKEIAEKIANKLSISKVYSELLPDDKLSKLEDILKSKNKDSKLVYVGDGINDAPSLKISDIGIAMGGLGSDAAIDAADIVIMNDQPSKLVTALNIARKTRRIVWQNIIFSFSIKGIFLISGALGIATMWGAVFADVGVAIIAVLNSLRILRPSLLTKYSEG